ncbi:hypothetical protein [Streptomyces roseoverticillatus]|uniref:hypothetical protein n=1 Tax=Streptomyces roseoverticillatus TaxID=66429 RepID=UPI000B17AAEE|nr:hypothetical protein [Streptomyces roseoverticillatus]
MGDKGGQRWPPIPSPSRWTSLTVSLAIPDFYILRRKPTELDEAYRKAHKG